MACSKFFSFAEIVKDRDASVRVTDDNMFVAVDLTMVVTGKDKDDSGKTLRRIPEDLFPTDKMSVRTLPGKGNANIKLVSFQNAIELIMVLPGKIAKETRCKFADIIRRYLGGDKSLIAEINANAASDSPIAQLARASMDAPASAATEVVSAEDLAERKRRREVEDTELHCKKLGNVKLFADTMSLINPRWSEDARLRMQTEDWLKNVAFNSQLALTHGGGGGGGGNNGGGSSGALTNGEDYRSITIGEVAHEMGKRLDHGQSIRVGSLVARKYQEKYGISPPKQRRWVDNAERNVCAYTEKDREIIVDALKELRMI